MRKRRLLSWMLALIMTLTLIPFSAMAEDGDPAADGTETQAALSYVLHLKEYDISSHTITNTEVNQVCQGDYFVVEFGIQNLTDDDVYIGAWDAFFSFDGSLFEATTDAGTRFRFRSSPYFSFYSSAVSIRDIAEDSVSKLVAVSGSSVDGVEVAPGYTETFAQILLEVKDDVKETNTTFDFIPGPSEWGVDTMVSIYPDGDSNGERLELSGDNLVTTPVALTVHPTYTITFDPNGGAVSLASAVTGLGYRLSSLPTPTQDGYTFNGWYTAQTGGSKVNERTSYQSDTTVYAHWVPGDWNKALSYVLHLKEYDISSHTITNTEVSQVCQGDYFVVEFGIQNLTDDDVYINGWEAYFSFDGSLFEATTDAGGKTRQFRNFPYITSNDSRVNILDVAEDSASKFVIVTGSSADGVEVAPGYTEFAQVLLKVKDDVKATNTTFDFIPNPNGYNYNMVGIYPDWDSNGEWLELSGDNLATTPVTLYVDDVHKEPTEIAVYQNGERLTPSESGRYTQTIEAPATFGTTVTRTYSFMVLDQFGKVYSPGGTPASVTISGNSGYETGRYGVMTAASGVNTGVISVEKHSSMPETLIPALTATYPTRDGETLTAVIDAVLVPRSDAPLKLVSSYNKSTKTATVGVVATETIALANYDILLDWDKSALTMTGAVNGLDAITTFLTNTNADQENYGKISAISDGVNVTIPANTTLASYTLTAETPLDPGDYRFSLTVRDVADENAAPLSWKAEKVYGTMTVTRLSLDDSFENRTGGAAEINCDTPVAGDFTVASERPCVAVCSNGSAYQRVAATAVDGVENLYSFALPADYDNGEKIVLCLRCDFTGEGKISSTDALQTLRVSVGDRDCDAVQLLVSDVNGDSELTSTDALQILRLCAGLRSVAW